MELVLLTSYNILEERNKAEDAKSIKDWFLRIEQENRIMPKTMREVLSKMFIEEGREEGLEEGRKEGLAESLSALKKAFSKRGVLFDDYQADLQKLTTVTAVADMIGDFMAADDPKTFLKERFGH